MIVDELKKSILQYAIQGKLTEQHDSDSEVNDVLRKIQEDNYDNKKLHSIIKKVKIEDTELNFNIPDTWEYVKLYQLLNQIFAGGDKPKKFFKQMNHDNMYPVISNGKINDGILGYTDKYTVDEKSITVSARGTIGYSVIRDTPFFPIVRLLVLIPNKLINIKYLKYALDYLVETGTGTAVKQLTIPMIVTKIIPLPPIEEQQRIVEKIELIFSELDKLKNTENKLFYLNQKLSSDIKQSILKYAITGNLTMQLDSDSEVKETFNELVLYDESEIYFDIPNTWKWIKFGDLVDYNMGKTPPRKELQYWGTDFNWVSIADMVSDGYTSVTKEKVSNNALKSLFKERYSKAGTLLMSFKLTVGRVSILNIDAVHNEAIISIYPKIDKDNIIRNYLFKILPMIVKYGNTKSAIKGNTLNSTSIGNLLIPLPPIEEQKRIVEKLDKLLPIVDSI